MLTLRRMTIKPNARGTPVVGESVRGACYDSNDMIHKHDSRAHCGAPLIVVVSDTSADEPWLNMSTRSPPHVEGGAATVKCERPRQCQLLTRGAEGNGSQISVRVLHSLLATKPQVCCTSVHRPAELRTLDCSSLWRVFASQSIPPATSTGGADYVPEKN